MDLSAEELLKSVDDLDLEPVFTIDLDEINELAKEDASDMVEKVSVAVVDEAWLQKNPTLRSRIELELESLRGLLKMRRTNEAAHDALVVAISRKPDQSSLYKSLTDMQRTGLAITGKINEIVESLSNLIRNKTQEAIPQDLFEEDNDDHTHRGTKDFIQSMS
jgi:hypothetical protein